MEFKNVWDRVQVSFLSLSEEKKWIDRLLHMDIEELEIGCLIE